MNEYDGFFLVGFDVVDFGVVGEEGVFFGV